MTARPFRILAVAYDYGPKRGGIATCGQGLLGALSRQPDVSLRLLARAQEGDLAFDQKSPIKTVRVALPQSAVASLLPFAWHIEREIRAFKPDAVLCFLWHPDGAAASLATALPGSPPFFVLAHGVELMETERTLRKRARKLLAPLKRRVLSRAGGVFAVSEFTRGLLERECSVPRERIRVVHNGVDASRFYPGEKARDLVERFRLEGKKVLITVSRLDDYKGMDRAIGALSRLPREHHAVYLICGEGKDRPRLERLAREAGVSESVVFAGAVPEGRLRDYYNLADAFVLLSREDWQAPNVEGFGIVFLEAGACGLPAIGGRSGGIPDVLVDGETGWLVNPVDEEEIAAAMKKVLADPMLARARGEAGRRRALERFSWDAMAQKVLTYVRD